MKWIARIEVDVKEAPKTIEDMLILLLRNSVYVYEPRPKVMRYDTICVVRDDDGCPVTAHIVTYVNLGDVIVEADWRYTIDEYGRQVVEKIMYDVYDNTVATTECTCDCYCDER